MTRLHADMTQLDWTASLRGSLEQNPDNVAIRMHLTKVQAQSPEEFAAHKAQMFHPDRVAERRAAAASMIREMLP